MRNNRLPPRHRIVPSEMTSLAMASFKAILDKNLFHLPRRQRLHANAISYFVEFGRRTRNAACSFVQSQTSAASRRFAFVSSIVSPSVKQPGKAGMVAQDPPSSASWMTARIFSFFALANSPMLMLIFPFLALVFHIIPQFRPARAHPRARNTPSSVVKEHSSFAKAPEDKSAFQPLPPAPLHLRPTPCCCTLVVPSRRAHTSTRSTPPDGSLRPASRFQA